MKLEARSWAIGRGGGIGAPRLPLLLLLVVGAAGACRGGGGGTSEVPGHQIAGADPRRGADAIRRYGCGSCHTIPGIRDARGMVGPPLTAFGRRTFIAGEVPNTADHLVVWIEVPQSIEPGTAMPNLGVSEGEARDIAAYLYTLH